VRKHLSSEGQKKIVEKALNRKNKSLREIAESHNIGYSTLGKWIAKYQSETSEATVKVKSKGNSNELSPAEKFEHIVSTSRLDEVKVGAYCRQHGIYSFQLQEWKSTFMTDTPREVSAEKVKEIKTLKAENKLLKKELRRKDSALAETAALLILKKKANLLWAVGEDE
jgi:hypothetical protein